MTPVDLAGAVGEASLRAAVALAAVLALRRALDGRTRADVRRALLLSAILAVGVLPAARAALPGVGLPWPAAAPEAPLAGGVGVPGPPAGGGIGLARVLAIAWLLGAAIGSGRLAAGMAAMAVRVRRARPLADPGWLDARDAVARGLGLSRPPALKVAREEVVPLAWGPIRPVVLLPPSALDWAPDRRRAVLAHECGHLARREPAARIAAEVVGALHWFDPLVRAAVTRLRRESERAADEAAIGLGIDPADYAGHLVALARRRGAVAGVAFATRGTLAERVESLLAPSRGREAGSRGALGLVGVAALAAVLVTAVPRTARESASSAAARLAERYAIPVEIADAILAAADREGIDRGVAVGLVAEESRFDPDRVSPRGAVGLTQVLPSTAREVDPGVDPEALRDVPTNLRVGFRYLRSQIDGQGGKVADGLMAYAVGPERLAAMRRAGSPGPTDYSDRILAHTR